MLLVPRSYTGDNDYNQCRHLAIYQIVVPVNEELREPFMEIHHQGASRGKCLIWHGKHEELYEDGNIYKSPEELIRALYLFCLFHLYFLLVFIAVLALAVQFLLHLRATSLLDAGV